MVERIIGNDEVGSSILPRGTSITHVKCRVTEESVMNDTPSKSAKQIQKERERAVVAERKAQALRNNLRRRKSVAKKTD